MSGFSCGLSHSGRSFRSIGAAHRDDHGASVIARPATRGSAAAEAPSNCQPLGSVAVRERHGDRAQTGDLPAAIEVRGAARLERFAGLSATTRPRTRGSTNSSASSRCRTPRPPTVDNASAIGRSHTTCTCSVTAHPERAKGTRLRPEHELHGLTLKLRRILLDDASGAPSSGSPPRIRCPRIGVDCTRRRSIVPARVHARRRAVAARDRPNPLAR